MVLYIFQVKKVQMYVRTKVGKLILIYIGNNIGMKIRLVLQAPLFFLQGYNYIQLF